jgi:Tfp pilus assembly protein PilN
MRMLISVAFAEWNQEHCEQAKQLLGAYTLLFSILSIINFNTLILDKKINLPIVDSLQP